MSLAVRLDGMLSHISPPPPRNNELTGAKDDPFFDEYRTAAQIDEYMVLLTVLHPELTRLVPSVGSSVEGNPIPALLVGGSNGGR